MKNRFVLNLVILGTSMLLATVISAQSMRVDETCTISILNRTVQANSDGSWQLPNVPSFMGRIRARANCLVDGQTVSGQSDFFPVVVNEQNFAKPISFIDLTPVPTTLEFTSSADVIITDTNQSIKLDVIARYSNGSQSEVLDVFSGLNIISSNPNIVDVDAEGNLFASSSGNALITARLEGAIAIKTVSVLLGGDTDGDGLPNDFELEQGLNPNDPFDAMEDQDRDGLSALEEFGLGTDINLDDTDGDGIEDGEEVIAGEDGFITSPLLADTDGDLVNDGLEVAGGSDPTDENSRDISAALDSIEIQQENFELFFNGIQTESSSQLSVIGHLIDGSQIDITDSSLGTNYSSSDLSIVSFGLTPGQVFAGADGVATITVSNNGLEDTVDITVSRFDPIALSTLTLPGSPERIDVAGSYIYIASGQEGLLIVDALDLTTPFITASIPTSGYSSDIKVVGGIAYLADDNGGLKVVDVNDPSSPSELTTYSVTGTGFRDIAIEGDYIVAASGQSGIELINISVPDAPIFSGRLANLGNVRYVDIDLSRDLVVAISGSELLTIDISDRTAPELVGRVDVSTPSDVILDDGVAYVAASINGYKVVEIQANKIPVLIGGTDSGNNDFIAVEVKIANGLAFFSDMFFSPISAPFINIEDPFNTFFQGVVPFAGAPGFGRGLAVDTRYAYLVSNNGTDGRLLISQYLEISDPRSVAPEISFTNISNGEEYGEGRVLSVQLEATDDVAVQAVSLLLDGVEIGTDTTYPFTINAVLPFSGGDVELQAQAIDFGGNLGETEVITLTINSDMDLDGLIDELEPTYSTDINDPDTDDDGLEDGREVAIGTDPLNPDTDGDGLSDSVEALQGTDPNSTSENWANETVTLIQNITVAEASVETSTINSDFTLM